MRRFAADGARRVLYYEERMEGSTVLAAIGMPEDGKRLDFVIVPELLFQVGTTPHYFDWSSYSSTRKQRYSFLTPCNV